MTHTRLVSLIRKELIQIDQTPINRAESTKEEIQLFSVKRYPTELKPKEMQTKALPFFRYEISKH
jgi:hypothetical protein